MYTATPEIYTYCHTLSLHAALPICWHCRGLAYLPFLQLARQCAPVHPQPPRGLRDVEIGLDQHLMDMLPFDRLDRRRTGIERRFGIALRPLERRFDIVGVRRLGEIIGGARSEEHTSELQSLMRIS